MKAAGFGRLADDAQQMLEDFRLGLAHFEVAGDCRVLHVLDERHEVQCHAIGFTRPVGEAVTGKSSSTRRSRIA